MPAKPADRARRALAQSAPTPSAEELPPDYDDYADYGAPRREEPKTRSRTLPVIIALLALGGFAGLLWYAYSWGVGGVESEDLPVVAAESSPAKVAPEEPGGIGDRRLDPHRDLLGQQCQPEIQLGGRLRGQGGERSRHIGECAHRCAPECRRVARRLGHWLGTMQMTTTSHGHHHCSRQGQAQPSRTSR